jgi:hypothetical protein
MLAAGAAPQHVIFSKVRVRAAVKYFRGPAATKSKFPASYDSVMKISSFSFSLLLFAAVFGGAFLFPADASAQRRDYLTDAEIEFVRENQQIDLRAGVLTKAVERRLAILKNESAAVKDKDSDKWGAPPEGTRQQLMIDIEKILQKAIDDIDDVATRGMDPKFFPKAMHKLDSSCQAFIPQFKSLFDTAKDEREKGALLGSMENCNAIIASMDKVPKEPAKEEKKKKN